MLELSTAEARALIEGEIIVAFADRGAITEGDEIPIEPNTSLEPVQIKPAYRRWINETVPEGWSGVVVSVDPATILDPEAGNSRHIRTEVAGGDLVVLRVYGPEGPSLSDAAFVARQRSVEGALRS